MATKTPTVYQYPEPCPGSNYRQFFLPMNSLPLGKARWLIVCTFLVDSGLDDPKTSPRPPAFCIDARGVGHSALCVATGMSREGDRLD